MTLCPLFAKEFIIDGMKHLVLKDYVDQKLQEEKAVHEAEERAGLEQIKRNREEAERRAQKAKKEALRMKFLLK